MKYRNIIFDLDGTLLNTSQGIFTSLNNTMEKLDRKKLDIEVLNFFVGPPIKDSFMKYCGFNLEEAIYATSLYREEYWNTGMYQATIYSGIEELLIYLKSQGYKITVATLKREDQAISILKEFDLLKYFDSVHGANEFGTLKKHHLITNACKSVGASIDESVMIGDTAHDAIGSEKVNIDFVAVLYGFGFKTLLDTQMHECMLTAVTVNDVLNYFKGLE